MKKEATAKQKLLQNLNQVYCRLMPSKIHGVGVFAIKDIVKGEEIISDYSTFDNI